MSYENKDLYLRLKQNCVLLEMAQLKATININGRPTDRHSIIGAICNDIAQIQSQFTTPAEMLADSPIYLDLSHEAAMLNGMLTPVPNTGDDRFKHLPANPEQMEDVIFKYPIFTPYSEAYNENLRNQSFFDRSRERASAMINAQAMALRSVRKWAEGTEEAGLELKQILLIINMVETFDWLFMFTNDTSRRQIMKTERELDEQFEAMDKMYDGMESVLNSFYEPASITGNESFATLHWDIWAGCEAETTTTTTTSSSSSSNGKTTSTSSKTTSSSSEGKSDKPEDRSKAREKIKGYMDSVKKVAQNLYKNLMDMLKRVREYFFGEGEQAAVQASTLATEAVEALNAMKGQAPIGDDAAARDPNVFMKAIQGGTEFQELLKDYPDLANALDKVKSAATKIQNSDNVQKLRTSYADLIKAANAGIQTVSGTLKRSLSEAEKKTAELKNPKTPTEGDTTEVKEGVKQENSAMIAAAKEETKKVRLIGGVRNKFVAALNAIATQSKTVKDKPPQSKFKG